MGPYRGKYLCNMVDCKTGLGKSIISRKPDQNTSIIAVLQWCATFGTPVIISSDQGTHFTGRNIQAIAEELGIQWDFHLAYNPTASGSIEKFNGLLKCRLDILKDTPLEKALPMEVFALNSRPRLNRRSPLEEVYDREIAAPKTPSEGPNCPAWTGKVFIKSRKDNKTQIGDTVGPGTSGTIWVSKGKVI